MATKPETKPAAPKSTPAAPPTPPVPSAPTRAAEILMPLDKGKDPILPRINAALKALKLVKVEWGDNARIASANAVIPRTVADHVAATLRYLAPELAKLAEQISPEGQK